MFELYSCAVGSGVHVHNYVMLLYLEVTLIDGEENDIMMILIVAVG